jgi:hypothetical protein
MFTTLEYRIRACAGMTVVGFRNAADFKKLRAALALAAHEIEIAAFVGLQNGVME